MSEDFRVGVNYFSLVIHQFSYRRYIIGSLVLLIGLSLLVYRYFIIDESSSDTRTLWIVDTSLSMMVEDISGSDTGMVMSRLDLAKRLVSEGVTRILGDHAILSYARTASVESPLTDDLIYLSSIISGLTPVENYGGSDIMSAMTLASTLYRSDIRPLHIILLTDGGILPDTLLELPVHFSLSVIGLGTTSGGKIPLGYSADGQRRYKYFSGSQIVVRYDPGVLKRLQDTYDAQLVERSTVSGFPVELIPTPITDRYRLILLLLATLTLVFAYFYHPYGPKQK